MDATGQLTGCRAWTRIPQCVLNHLWCAFRGCREEVGRGRAFGKILLSAIGALGVLAAAAALSPVHGQLPLDSKVELRVATVVDWATSDSIALSHFFPRPTDHEFSNEVTRRMVQVLKRRFAEAAYESITVGDSEPEVRSPDTQQYDVGCSLAMSSEGVLYVYLRVTRVGQRTLLSNAVRQFTLSDTSVSWRDLEIAERSPQRRKAMEDLATQISNAAAEPAFTAITESVVRLRVRVKDFKAIVGDSSDLSRFLHRTVEAELVRSAAMFVATAESDQPLLRTNYELEGSYSYIGGMLHVDVRCLRTGRERRLLASEFFTLDSTAVNPERLSTKLREIVRALRYAMESDFSRTKTLAIIATSGSQAFSLKPPSRRDMGTVREIMRAVAQKTRLLTGTGETDLLDVQVLTDVEAGVRYSRAPDSLVPAPTEMLADLDVDLLLLITYQDLGQQVRLSANLHSGEFERPASGIYVHERVVDLSQLGAQLDTTVVELCKTLVTLRMAGHGNAGPEECEAAFAQIQPIRVKSLLRSRHFAVRVGSSVKHNSADLFLGREGSLYLELGYQIRPGLMRFGKAGGQFDGGFEVSLAVEGMTVVGSYLSFDGPATMTALFTTFVTLTPWEYSSTALNLHVGLAAGFQALRWNLQQGDIDFRDGELPYRNSAFSFVWGFIGELDVPMSFLRGISVDIVVRWLPKLPGVHTVQGFRDLPLDRFSQDGGPTGKLGGVYIMGGMAYNF